jgi:hypothetical protein
MFDHLSKLDQHKIINELGFMFTSWSRYASKYLKYALSPFHDDMWTKMQL